MARPDLPDLPPDTDFVAYLLSLPLEQRTRALELLGAEERDSLDLDWRSWAHRGQFPPEGDWRTWVLMAGRGFGKTLAGAKWITAQIAREEPLRIALVGATLEDTRRVMVEGASGLLAVAGAWVTEWAPSLHRLKFRSGAEATLFSGASPDMLRGPEHHFAWCDELAKWEKPGETWDMLQLGLRLGDHPRTLVTTTPRPGPVLRRIMAARDCVTTGGPTSANPHLPDAWKAAVYDLYAGTRFGRQELDGELLPDTPGALWTVELLERCRAQTPLPAREGQGVGPSEARPGPAIGGAPAASSHLHADPPLAPPLQGGESRDPDPRHAFTRPPLVRIVIAVDPPAGDGTCGIIACGKDAGGNAHILADHSVTARTPEGWSRAVADAARIHAYPLPSAGEGRLAEGERGEGPLVPLHIVAEANQGGKMVKAVLHTADPTLKVKLVTATVGKPERAAPIAMLFEAGRILLHARFPELEAELCGMIAGGEYEGPGTSPDRADAMVWGLTELMLTPERTPPRVLAL